MRGLRLDDLRRLMGAHWTCNHCGTVFWADDEPFNGHALACPKCWTLPCQGADTCRECQRKAREAFRALSRLVTGDRDPARFDPEWRRTT